MLLFCPTCSNVLTVEEGSGPSLYRFACQTCPYVYNITKKVRIRVGMLHILRGVTALTRAVSGEKQIYSGNLEILPGIGKPGKFFGKYEIFSGH